MTHAPDPRTDAAARPAAETAGTGPGGPDAPGPTIGQVARRPRSVALLALALVIAAGFAALGQWQLARAVESGVVIERDTETALPLGTLVEPQGYVTDRSAGHMVTVQGSLVPGDYVVVSDRLNAGRTGAWVVGHLSITDAGVPADPSPDALPDSVPVALGWAPTDEEAAGVAASLNAGDGAPEGAREIVGRFLPSEQPEPAGEGQDPERMTRLSTAALVNLWPGDVGAVYNGFIVASEPVAGLTAIDSPPPSEAVQLNWLNIFYAAEWAVFAIFAIVIWYRTVRDTWTREQPGYREDDDDEGDEDPLPDGGLDDAGGAPRPGIRADADR
ncbi:SURF1 family protein [Clavibacter lycopersici]|uniref:SURF1-like protein n=1 Tax=Clavibacter lycopersici TaxID=2301718 RepID=A0A399T4C1_9MICO|nr:SURF1 family cytochrome oxidase biogenesis protein [Clavibacter lycopersici]RIJ49622.1 SURF1 family protein [Clavibacter lycopersici]RIJ56625.1 SURF1 family protein [Clavibacter lycopersici]